MSALATAAAAATAAGAATRAHGARGCSPSSDPSLLHAAGSDVIFRKATSLEALNASSRNTAMEALGIVFTEIGDDYVRGTMPVRSEEHTSELQSLMRISYAVFCLKKKKTT